MNISVRRAVATFAALVFVVLLLPPPNVSAKITYVTPFKDVADNHPFLETIKSLKSKGFVKGYADGTFAPDTSVSRAEFITMVMAATGAKTEGGNCFKDVKQEWFAKFVCTAKKQGLIKGYADKTFKPNNNINFAEASAIIANAFKLRPGAAAAKDPWYKPAIQKLQARAAIPTTVDYVEKNLSRAETGEMLLRLKTNITDRTTKTYENLTAPFPTLGSCAELKDKIAAYKYSQDRENRMFLEKAMPMPLMAVPQMATGNADVSAEAEAAEESAPSSAPTSAPYYSTTNVQVEGVDEADIIKNDASHIYIVSDKYVRVIKAYPAEDMQEISKQTFDDENFRPSELYVTENKLIVLGSTYVSSPEPMPLLKIMPGYYPRGRSRIAVYVFSMDADKKLTQDRIVSFDGGLTSSRRIGGRLYLVLSNYLDFYGRTFDDVSAVEAELPAYNDSKTGKDEFIAGCADIHFLPQYNEMNFVTVAGLDINDSSKPVSKETIMGAGNTIYSSLQNMYVVGTRYQYPVFERFDVWAPRDIGQKTVIYRFNLGDDGTVSYKTQGEVKGTVLNQFSMDEQGNTFRIATTTGEVWDKKNPSKNHLFVLDKDNLGTVLGKIEDIAPGERIYSVRFLGNRAYMVTFKKVDPFFVIDLKDSANPKILGALKIPGFSDYLHPFDENHIIGFGKDTVDPTDLDKAGFNNNDFDFAWYQGMKIALFDVTDVANPTMMFKTLIGDRGTDSEVLYNHKALLYDKTKNLFALPVSVTEIKNKTEGQYTGSQYGENVFNGAYVYTLDLQNGFQLKGKITHFDDPEVVKKQGFLWNYNYGIKRIVEIGDYLYTFSLAKLKATKTENMEEAKSIAIEAPSPSVWCAEEEGCFDE